MCGKINLNQIKFNFIGEERNKQEKTQRKPNKKNGFCFDEFKFIWNYGKSEKQMLWEYEEREEWLV